jgi:hypothetical protein
MKNNIELGKELSVMKNEKPSFEVQGAVIAVINADYNHYIIYNSANEKVLKLPYIFIHNNYEYKIYIFNRLITDDERSLLFKVLNYTLDEEGFWYDLTPGIYKVVDESAEEYCYFEITSDLDINVYIDLNDLTYVYIPRVFSDEYIDDNDLTVIEPRLVIDNDILIDVDNLWCSWREKLEICHDYFKPIPIQIAAYYHDSYQVIGDVDNKELYYVVVSCLDIITEQLKFWDFDFTFRFVIKVQEGESYTISHKDKALRTFKVQKVEDELTIIFS